MTLAEKAAEMQNNSASVPRLKIPAYQWWSEALHGVINDGVTGTGADGLPPTFDAPDPHDGGTDWDRRPHQACPQNAREGHTGIMGGLDFWSPNLNIFRDPRWGRGQETYGEDPFLTGRMGVAYVMDCRAITPDTISPLPHLSTSRYIADRNQHATLQTWTSASTTKWTHTSLLSALPSWKARPDP